MRKAFWDNPYQQCLETKVSQVDGNVVVFEETIGFSECGGQESDTVTANDIRALSSYMDKCAGVFKQPLVFEMTSEDNRFSGRLPNFVFHQRR